MEKISVHARMNISITLMVITVHKREPTSILMVIWVKNVQIECMVEIYSRSLVRAIGKVLLMK